MSTPPIRWSCIYQQDHRNRFQIRGTCPTQMRILPMAAQGLEGKRGRLPSQQEASLRRPEWWPRAMPRQRVLRSHLAPQRRRLLAALTRPQARRPQTTS